MPEVFDEARPRFAAQRAELRRLLGAEGYAAAARNTLNAHYTDADLVAALWTGLLVVSAEQATFSAVSAGQASPAIIDRRLSVIYS